MPSVLETTTTMQDKLFESMQVGQQSVLDAVKTWADMVESMSAKVPEMPIGDFPVKPTELIQTYFGFTEKVLSSQKDFLTSVFETAAPALRPPPAAKTTAAKAAAKA